MKNLKLSFFLVLAVLFAAILFALPAVEAQGTEGSVYEVEVDGDVLYAVIETDSSTMLNVYDLSDALSPVQIGDLDLSAEIVHGMVVSGDLAHIRVGAALWVVDVSDPANPAVLDQSVDAYGFAVRDRYLYVRYEHQGEKALFVYRVDDEGHPQHVSTFTLPTSTTVELSVAEETMDDDVPVLDWPYLYFSSNDYNGPRIDVSDPANPVAAGGFNIISMSGFSVKDGIGYGELHDIKVPGAYSLYVTDVDGEWYRSFPEVLTDGRSYVGSFEMAGDTYLIIGESSSFVIRDFSQFSFETGEGPAPIIYQDGEGAFDTAYHDGQGVIYVARGSGGLDVMRAPFVPIKTYFPIVFTK